MSTLVLTDLVDSTGLIQTLGDARAAQVFRRVDRVARDLLTKHNGQEIDRTDGHLVLFDLPLAGVEYAITLHERLAELSRELGLRLSCRAAVHVGEVIVRENAPEDVARGAKPVEVEGLAKPATARLLSLALPSQTLLGRTAFELARRAAVGQSAFDHYVWASHGDYRFQGLDEPFAVHEVGLLGHAPLHAPPDAEKARRSTLEPVPPAPAKRRRAAWLLLVPLGVAVFASAFGFFLARGPTAPSPAPPLARFIVNPPGVSVSAEGACLGSPLAISHDGRIVAFTAADKTGGRELGVVVRPLDVLDVRPAHLLRTPLGPAGAQTFPTNIPGPGDGWSGNSSDPFFSPDDRWLGFFQGGQLGRVLLAGGSPERVESGADTASSSAKGAVWTSAGIVAAPGIWSGLVSFPLGEGPAVGLTSPDTARGETSHRWPDLLPDGRHMLVSIKSRSLATFDDGEIGVVGVDGGVPEVVWSGGYFPRYSPSGHIVFARQGSLMAVPFDAERRVVTGPAVVALRDVTMSPDNGTAAFAIAQNGTLVYVPGGTCQVATELVWTSPDGTQEAIDLPADFYGAHNLSPDGTRVAVTAMGAYDLLYVVHLERKTLTRVTFGVNASSGGVWDSEGDHLFVAISDMEGGAIAKIRADGTGEPQILHRIPSGVRMELNELVSVDGKPMLLGSIGNDIVLLSVGGEAEITPVVEEPFSEFGATVSPNGRCLAYALMASGESEVYVRPFPTGTGRTQVSRAGGSRPLWSDDGRWLLYITPGDADTDPSRRRVAVATNPADCLAIATGNPTPMAAPPGERVLEIREVEPAVQSLDVVAIQGWADTLSSPASSAAETPAAP